MPSLGVLARRPIPAPSRVHLPVRLECGQPHGAGGITAYQGLIFQTLRAPKKMVPSLYQYARKYSVERTNEASGGRLDAQITLGIPLAQHLLVELAHAGLGNLVDEGPALGHLPSGDLAAEVLLEPGRVDRGVSRTNHRGLSLIHI